MNGDAVKIALFVGLAAAVNYTARIRNGKEGVSTIVGSVVVFFFLVILGAIWRQDLPLFIAGLFLVSSLVINGVPFITAINQLVNGVRK